MTITKSPQSLSTNHIPDEPGVYFFKDAKANILYIGKAKNLHKRVQQYFTPWSIRKQDMVNKATSVDFVTVTSEQEALALECNLIKKSQPPYNRLLKADNSYVYIKITNEPFPQLFLTRNRQNDKATYIGPKNNTRELKNLLQYMRQIYKFRTMKSTEFRQGKVSSDFYFWLDKWRSVIAKLNQSNADDYRKYAQSIGLHLTKSYDEYRQEYKQIITKIKKFFSWNTKEVENDLKQQIAQCIAEENFERAATLRDIYYTIESFIDKQHVVIDPSVSGHILYCTQIVDFSVFIVLHFHEGKLIDIIRQKQLTTDSNRNQIITWFETEFDDLPHVHTQSERELILLSWWLKTIKKTTRKEIDNLIHKFLDSYIQWNSFENNSVMNTMLIHLQQKYHLKSFPYRIECADISHLSWGRMSGWLSCFVWWVAYKYGYRKYKIKSIDKKWTYSNDYASLKELITRRFRNNESLPDLFIIDGWIAQLNILKELLEKLDWFTATYDQIQFVALGKWSARNRSGKNQGETEVIYKFDEQWEIQSYPLDYDQSDQLLTKIRDESHRFANQYRKKQMSSEWKKL